MRYALLAWSLAYYWQVYIYFGSGIMTKNKTHCKRWFVEESKKLIWVEVYVLRKNVTAVTVLVESGFWKACCNLERTIATVKCQIYVWLKEILQSYTVIWVRNMYPMLEITIYAIGCAFQGNCDTVQEISWYWSQCKVIRTVLSICQVFHAQALAWVTFPHNKLPFQIMK